MGASAAWKAAAAGWEVTLFERSGFSEALGSSRGRSRIVRQAYPDAYYTSFLLDGHREWSRLEALAGERLYHEVGLLYFGPEDAEDVVSGEAALASLGVPYTRLGPADLPPLPLSPGEIGILSPEAGWVAADLVLRSLWRLAAQEGCSLVQRQVSTLTELAVYDRVLVAAGPWMTEWWNPQIEVTRQTYAYIEGRREGPVWIESGEHFFYGFPSEPGRQDFKAGVHVPGEPCHPDDPGQAPDHWALELLLDLARRRFRILNPRITEAGHCWYTHAPESDFRFGWLDERTLAVSACSGHGFKFGPWMGGLIQRLLSGEDDLANWPRFQA